MSDDLQDATEAMVAELHALLDDCAQGGDETGAVYVWAVREVLNRYAAKVEQIKAERLLAHIFTAKTRWFKVSHALLNFGRRNVPEDRDSRNPAKWLAGEIGVWMDDVQTRRTNGKLDGKLDRR